MADISKCKNLQCPLKENCYRYTVPANEFWQTYADFQYTKKEDGTVVCDYFWDNEQTKNKIKDEE